jgi:dsRNA-specific ribonuclease
MPIKRLKNGRYRAKSYVTGKMLGPASGETKAKAEARAATSRRRSRRKRSTNSRRARRRY